MGTYLMSVCVIDMYLTGVHLMGVYLIVVYLIVVYLIRHVLGGYASQRCAKLGASTNEF